jgi:hypothetical protein
MQPVKFDVLTRKSLIDQIATVQIISRARANRLRHMLLTLECTDDR